MSQLYNSVDNHSFYNSLQKDPNIKSALRDARLSANHQKLEGVFPRPVSITNANKNIRITTMSQPLFPTRTDRREALRRVQQIKEKKNQKEFRDGSANSYYSEIRAPQERPKAAGQNGGAAFQPGEEGYSADPEINEDDRVSHPIEEEDEEQGAEEYAAEEMAVEEHQAEEQQADQADEDYEL